MAGRDADRPQLDFPQLTADIIRQLRLTGQLGLLEFSDQVAPVYIVAQREGALSFTVAAPVFESAEVVDLTVTNVVANAILADTGQLPAGDYDIYGAASQAGLSGGDGALELQHRDAANAATLAVVMVLTLQNATGKSQVNLPLIGYQIGLNERLRWQNTGGTANGSTSSMIAAHRRVTP